MNSEIQDKEAQLLPRERESGMDWTGLEVELMKSFKELPEDVIEEYKAGKVSVDTLNLLFKIHEERALTENRTMPRRSQLPPLAGSQRGLDSTDDEFNPLDRSRNQSSSRNVFLDTTVKVTTVYNTPIFNTASKFNTTTHTNFPH